MILLAFLDGQRLQNLKTAGYNYGEEEDGVGEKIKLQRGNSGIESQ